MPAGDPRIDYYTDGPDNYKSGAAEPTVPGYGPNTRTIMQIVVGGTTKGKVYDAASLATALPTAYSSVQEQPIVPEKAYQNAFPDSSTDNYARIYTGTLAQPYFTFATVDGKQGVASVVLKAQGSGYTSAPTATFAGGGGSGAAAYTTLSVSNIAVSKGGSKYITPPTVKISAPPAGGTLATAVATISGGRVSSVNVINTGSGYLSVPTVTFVGGGGSGAVATAKISLTGITLTSHGYGYTALPAITLSGGGGKGGAAVATALSATVSLPVYNKAIQELFEPNYGRMNATLGVELPFTSSLTQTTIPLGYIDPATESMVDGETQIWKITHNGVDTHPVHFHLVNVQVINRIGWDGTVKPPDGSEVGWKETVIMNPLEDIVVAARAIKPPLPGFGLPKSSRALDPTQPLGSTIGFTQIDPLTNKPMVVANEVVDFDWEYVWHCHILGHEENDFMRPFIFHANEAAPAAPTIVSTVAAADGASITVNWADNAATEYQYLVERHAGTATATTASGWTTVGTALANAGKPEWITPGTMSDPVTELGKTYTYRVSAVGANGMGASVVTVKAGTPDAPSNLTGTATWDGTTSNDSVVLSWNDNSTNETGFSIQRATNTAFTGSVTTTSVPANVITYTVTVPRGKGPTPTPAFYFFRICANNKVGSSSWSNTATVGTK